MYIPLIIFISLVGILLFLWIVFFFLIFAYTKLAKRFYISEQQKYSLRQHLQERSASLIEEAQEKALVIITDANSKAQLLLENTNLLENDAKENFKKGLFSLTIDQQQALQVASEQLKKQYRTTIDAIQQENINVLKTVSKDIESDIDTELKDFTKALRDETIDSQKIAQQKIEASYKDTEQAVEKYRTERLQKVDENIFQVLRFVSLKAFGKALSLETQQELVLEALNEAKKQKGF